MKIITYYLYLFFIIISYKALGYNLPLVNLGGSSFLDGGPLRSKPGWYFNGVTSVYSTHRFLDNKGKLLGNAPSPHFTVWGATFQGIYVFPQEILWAHPGVDVVLPVSLHSSIQENHLGITSQGCGIGDIAIGAFLQFRAILKDEIHNKIILSPSKPPKKQDLLWLLETAKQGKFPIRPIFVHRLEFFASFPSGQTSKKAGRLTPGNGVYFIDPYWAFTLFFTPRWGFSGRIHYLWCAISKNGKQPGTALHGTFALEHAFSRNIYAGINGYYLYQLTDTTINGIPLQNSQDRLFALGPGGLFAFGKNYNNVLFANLYFEAYVRNRSQGIKFNFRFLKYF